MGTTSALGIRLTNGELILIEPAVDLDPTRDCLGYKSVVG